MIVDTLENASRYYMLHPSMEQAFDFLESLDPENFPDGKTELEGEHLYGNGMVKETRDENESIWESHTRYLDIHYLVEGDERIYHSWDVSMKETKPYDSEKDLTVYQGHGNEVFVPRGGFVIFFPGEIHKALVHGVNGANMIKKMVVKLDLG